MAKARKKAAALLKLNRDGGLLTIEELARILRVRVWVLYSELQKKRGRIPPSVRWPAAPIRSTCSRCLAAWREVNHKD